MADELDPRARALLAAYRRDAGPSSAATERLLASVRRSAAAAEEARVVPLRPRSSSRQWLGVAVVGLVAAALALAFKLSPRRLDADADAARSAAALQSADEAASTSVTSRVRQGGGSATIDVVPEQAADTEPPLQRPGANDEADGATASSDANRGAAMISTPAKPQGRGPGAATARGSAGTPAAANGASVDKAGAAATNADTPGPTNATGGGGDALAEELAIVRAVNDSLAGGSAEQALARLDDYHRRFPAGALREEAAALRAVALCAAGRADGASAAEAFLRAHPGSLSAERVRRSCGVR
ncbi:hypothetical protein OV090_06890 [Nannocystis sp. RBIL2]|uniref:hypothetical protein n=1 Tax=Nannocystis sp. RBIL2 TaxID=2996788 RepID=UPI00226D8265|nr:hypothetical protein [Nannocystis sp. RBIL2]MCY1064479.1 hypothetical protein [Nannocystis sp. RBIL2]